MMQDPRDFAATQYRIHPLVFLTGAVVVVLVFQMVTSNTYLTFLPSSCTLGAILILVFTAIGLASPWLAGWGLRRAGLDLPTVGLWVHPFLMILLTSGLALGMLVAWPAYAGRGFWSGLLRLNPKVTTILFTTTFCSFGILIGILVLWEIVRYLGWSVAVAEELWKNAEGEAAAALASVAKGDTATLQASLAGIKDRIGQLEEARQRANRFNRLAALGMFLALVLVGSWVVFFRPEVILFYRGEIQLRSFREPEVALETFDHLARRYPRYEYLDTVKYFAAWTLERRLGRYAEGARRYSEFLDEFGSENIWADEVMTNLVRLNLDKLHNPEAAVLWAERYRRKFPDGIMAPHVALYEVRALNELNRPADAQKILAEARQKFDGRRIELYDSEDDFVSSIPFEAALRGLDL